MKRITWFPAAWLALLACNAQATISHAEREHVQTIVWIVEGASFITIIAVFWFIWRISMRARANRKSEQAD